MDPVDVEETYLLIDGENINATLGLSVLERRPTPEERPRWDRIREATEQFWDQHVRGLFFLNGLLAHGLHSGSACDGLSCAALGGPRGYESC